MIDLDPRDLAQIEAALDALETLHDAQAIGNEYSRVCLCGEASSWRSARQVVVAWRRELGLTVRLLDQV